MKSFTFLLGALAASSYPAHATGPFNGQTLGKRAQCNPDNCARAVTGTSFATASQAIHRADCSSFFSLIAIYPPETITRTVTGPPTFVTAPGTTSIAFAVSYVYTGTSGFTTTNVETTLNTTLKRRQVATATSAAPLTIITPTRVPAYASACNGTARYSSACSCLGVKPTTTTVHEPLATITTVVPGPTETQFVPIISTSFSRVNTVAVQELSDYILCNQVISGPIDGDSITVICEAEPTGGHNIEFDSRTTSDWDECVRFADADARTKGFAFDIDNSLCTLYEYPRPIFSYQPATHRVFAHFAEDR